MFRYFIFVSALTLLWIATGFMLFSYVIPQEFVVAIPIALALVYAGSLLVQYFLRLSLQKKTHREFNLFFMLTTTGKLMCYLFLILLYVVFWGDNNKAFLVSFLLFYLSFTAVETISVQMYLNSERRKKN
ncbi:MAG: hypothetical protein RIS47_194 [Bacteroidota bacterium]|jgi:hypothetical protein